MGDVVVHADVEAFIFHAETLAEASLGRLEGEPEGAPAEPCTPHEGPGWIVIPHL